RHRRLRPVRGGSTRRQLFVRGRNRVAGGDLYHRHHGDLFSDPGKERRGAGIVSAATVIPRCERAPARRCWSNGLSGAEAKKNFWSFAEMRARHRGGSRPKWRGFSIRPYPNLIGGEQKRIITSLTPDELRYTNPATSTGTKAESVWRRAK